MRLTMMVLDDFYDNPAEFEIRFNARDERLSYYVVARNYSLADLNALTVQDAGFADDGRGYLDLHA
jgi:hypothetical protein